MPAHASSLSASSHAPSSGALRIGASRRLAPYALAALAVLVLIAALVALCVGAYRIPPAQAWAALTGDAAAQQARAVLFEIRAPRVALALLVGGGFGAAGAAMQALFRNPLADPGLVGVSSGAALGATTTIVLGPALFAAHASAAALPVAAFAGALAVAALVYRLPPRRAAGSRCRCCCSPASRSTRSSARRSGCSRSSPTTRSCAR